MKCRANSVTASPPATAGRPGPGRWTIFNLTFQVLFDHISLLRYAFRQLKSYKMEKSLAQQQCPKVWDSSQWHWQRGVTLSQDPLPSKTGVYRRFEFRVPRSVCL
jgi:hypothetical protein